MTETDDRIVALISQGVDRSKLGEARQVYDEIVATGLPIPTRSHYAFGWIIYYALHQWGDRDIAPRKHLLHHYLQLNSPRPHKLHSMILTEALRLRENINKSADYARRRDQDAAMTFSLMRFLPLWGISNLRPGDWNRHEFQGKRLSSTVEKLITLYVSEAEKSKTPPPAYFLTLADRALTEYPDSYNLLSQRATLHIMEGETERAATLLRNALVMAPGKFHLWSRLASLVDQEKNPRLRMALFARALTAPGNAEFKGKIRLSLASIWLEQGFAGQAAWELEGVRRLYTAKEWHLPRLHGELSARIPDGTRAEDPRPVYSKLTSMADEEIYSALPAITAKKTYHKNPQPDQSDPYGRRRPNGPAWRVTDGYGGTYWFQPQRYGIDPNLPLGTDLIIRVHNGKIVDARINSTFAGES